jgi:hypothetical protein
MDTVIVFWNDSKDDFQNVATKYANSGAARSLVYFFAA